MVFGWFLDVFLVGGMENCAKKKYPIFRVFFNKVFVFIVSGPATARKAGPNLRVWSFLTKMFVFGC